MNGMQMMLKSMGVEPEKIQAQLTQAKDAIEAKVTSVDEKLSLILEKLTRIETKLQTMPDSEVMKLLAENSELESMYVRGNNSNSDGNDAAN